jgi:hypothetical protein
VVALFLLAVLRAPAPSLGLPRLCHRQAMLASQNISHATCISRGDKRGQEGTASHFQAHVMRPVNIAAVRYAENA